MTPEIERLLGGYATNTLTEEERKSLYEGALEDQALFNALEDEQALRELLADEDSRREIERALRPAPAKAAKPRRLWIWGLAASLAAVAVLVMLLRRTPQPKFAAVVSAPRPSLVFAPEASAVPVPRRLAKKKARVEPGQTHLGSGAPAQSPAVASEPVQVDVQSASAPAPASAADSVARLAKSTPSVSSGPLGGAKPVLSAQAGNQYRVSIGTGLPAPPLLILRTQPDGTFTELKSGEVINAGDAIQVKLRPSIPGTLTLSELSAGSPTKTLPPDQSILIDHRRLIGIEWKAPDMTTPQMTLLDLIPGKRLIIEPPK